MVRADYSICFSVVTSIHFGILIIANKNTFEGLVECRVDVTATKMGHNNLSAKSHDTENLRKLHFVSLSVVRAWQPIKWTLN